MKDMVRFIGRSFYWEMEEILRENKVKFLTVFYLIAIIVYAGFWGIVKGREWWLDFSVGFPMVSFFNAGFYITVCFAYPKPRAGDALFLGLYGLVSLELVLIAYGNLAFTTIGVGLYLAAMIASSLWLIGRLATNFLLNFDEEIADLEGLPIPLISLFLKDRIGEKDTGIGF